MQNMPTPQQNIQRVPAYSKAKGTGAVRWIASSNEAPVAPSQNVIRTVAEAIKHGNRYPSMFGEKLITALAENFKLAENEIVVGAGSISLLQLALTTFTGPEAEVVYAWRSYEAYPIATRVAGATPVEVPLTYDGRHDFSSMANAITSKTRAVVICNPNNPTGTVRALEHIEAFIQRIPSNVLVILDEAYREFMQTPVDGLDLLAHFPNLLVMRTFSKAYGLAGVRAGYAFGHPDLLEGIRKAIPPFSLSALAETAGIAALADSAHMRRIVSTIIRDRDTLQTELQKRGLQIPDSQSNFVWVPAEYCSEQIVAACLKRGVSVRAFPGEGVRITVGQPEASKAVMEAIDEVLRAQDF